MKTFQFALEYSSWYILLCIAIGAGYSYWLYRKKYSWGLYTNRFLALLRFLLVTIICLLFLEPIMHNFISHEEKPVAVIAIDNSSSMQLNASSKELQQAGIALKELKTTLEERGFAVDVKGTESPLDSLEFNTPYTDITELLLSIQEKYEDHNLGPTILFSDGMYNKGGSPLYRNYLFNIHTIGFGDTTEKQDVILKTLLYNKITYPNTIFPIHAEIKNTGFKGNQTTVVISENGEVLDSKTISFKRDKGVQSVAFEISANKPGLHKYTISVKELNGEYTTKNNNKTAYIELIDGSQNILIAANSPHPDIKAIKLAMAQQANIIIDMFIPGINPLDEKKKYDLVIMHQVPNIYNNGTNLLNKYFTDDTPVLHILGNQSNIKSFNKINNCITIQERGNKDEVSADINENFSRFTLHEDIATLEKAPPLMVPYGEVILKPQAEVFSYQKIGNSSNGLPLITFNVESKKKTGVILGEGIWKWRLFEYRQNQSQEAFDDLISNIIQLLANKADNRKFIVQTTSRQYDQDEKVTFVSEVYNDVLENIYDQEINLTLTSKENQNKLKYTFTNSQYNNKHIIGNLEHGIYTYTATTKVGDKTLSYSNEFVVKKSDLEALTSLADHHLLKNLSLETGGEYVTVDKTTSLLNHIDKKRYKDKIHTTESTLPAINLKWIFFLLMTLATVEWGLRKYLGSY